MILRFMTLTDSVTGSIEEQIEEFDDMKIKLIEENVLCKTNKFTLSYRFFR